MTRKTPRLSEIEVSGGNKINKQTEEKKLQWQIP